MVVWIKTLTVKTEKWRGWTVRKIVNQQNLMINIGYKVVSSRDSRRRFKGRHPDLWATQQVDGWSYHLLMRVHCRRSIFSENYPLTWKDYWFFDIAIPNMYWWCSLFYFYFYFYLYLSNSIHRETSFWLTNFTLASQFILEH